jgi:hypothetical protein
MTDKMSKWILRERIGRTDSRSNARIAEFTCRLPWRRLFFGRAMVRVNMLEAEPGGMKAGLNEAVAALGRPDAESAIGLEKDAAFCICTPKEKVADEPGATEELVAPVEVRVKSAAGEVTEETVRA